MSYPFRPFDVLISERDIFPRLGVVDICPTYKLRLMDFWHLFRLFRTLENSPGGKLTLWENEVRFLLFPGIILVLMLFPKFIEAEIPRACKGEICESVNSVKVPLPEISIVAILNCIYVPSIVEMRIDR